MEFCPSYVPLVYFAALGVVTLQQAELTPEMATFSTLFCPCRGFSTMTAEPSDGIFH